MGEALSSWLARLLPLLLVNPRSRILDLCHGPGHFHMSFQSTAYLLEAA